MSKHALATIGTLTVLATTSLLTGCGQSAVDAAGESPTAPDTLVIAVIPSEDQTQLDPGDDLVAQILSEELGMEVEYHFASSYAATIEAQRAGRAQVAAYGPFSYVIAKDSGVDIEPIGTATSEEGEATGYHSVASVRAGSDITGLADVEGKKVCFVDPASTSGYLFPTAGLLEAGIDPVQDITPVFAGGHDASVLALADGQCDLAFSTESMATEQLIESGQVEPGDVAQVWQSELIPNSPVAVSSDLPAEVKQKIKDTYLNKVNVTSLQESGRCDESAEDGNCGLERWGYLPVDDSVYDGVRAVCATTKAEACTAIG